MIKGETLKLGVTSAETAAVEFRFGGPETRAIAATKSGDEFTATAPTVSWLPGLYAWQAWATFADATVAVIASGTLELSDPLSVGDVRTDARKMVAMIEEMMAGNASKGVRRYKINNRELERYSVGELMQLLSYWRERMKREERAAKGAAGLGPRISVRF